MNCSNYLAHKKNSGITESLIIEINFIAGTSNSLCVEFGATNHIFNTLQEFQKIIKLSDCEVTLYLGSKARVVAVFVGVVEFFFPSNKILILYDQVCLSRMVWLKEEIRLF